MMCSKCDRDAVSNGFCKTHYMGWRYRQHGYGKWDSVSKYTPAAPVQEHVNALRAAGIGLRRLVELSGLPRRTIFEVSRREPKRVLKTTAEALMTIPMPSTPHDELVMDNVFIPATGTARRLQALNALGYSGYEIARLLGYASQNNFSEVTRGRRTKVTARIARLVDGLYRELQMTPGPSDRARAAARRRGFVSPFAWDDETIDDPDAQPNIGDRIHVSAIERITELQDLGVRDLRHIAQRLGVLPKSVERALDRRNERDVA